MLKRSAFALLSFALLLSACSGKKDRYNGMKFQLPAVTEYKEVIAAALKNDTALAPDSMVVSADVLAMKFETPDATKERKDTGTVIIRPAFSSFAQQLREFEMIANDKDSLYSLFQNDSAKDIQIDRTVTKALLMPLKQVESESFKRPSLIIMLPVFNADKTKALIRMDKTGNSSGDYILEKTGDQWRIKSKKMQID